MHDEEPGGAPIGSEDATTAGPPAADETRAASGLREPWVKFAVTFSVLVAVTEVFYHSVALESEYFLGFLRGLAQAAGALLTPFYDRVTVMSARVATESFVVTVDYGCDGLQVCTLLSSAVLAFPATIKQKIAGIVLGNMWLQSWNVLRIATLVVIGGFHREAFEPAHVYVWPAILVALCLATWMVWARWTMRDDELAA